MSRHVRCPGCHRTLFKVREESRIELGVEPTEGWIYCRSCKQIHTFGMRSNSVSEKSQAP